MGRNDWYRRTEWSLEDQHRFHDRLGRCRSDFAKAQYLRIQANSLADVGKFGDAVNLLNKLFEQYPDRLQVALAHYQMACCFAAIGNNSGAVEEFRRSLNAERASPQMGTKSWVDYPWFLVSHQLTEYYDEATALMEEFASDANLVFSVARYRYAAARSLIYSAKGEVERAREFARAALNACAQNHSGFRYRPTSCLVKDTSLQVHQRLLAIESGQVLS